MEKMSHVGDTRELISPQSHTTPRRLYRKIKRFPGHIETRRVKKKDRTRYFSTRIYFLSTFNDFSHRRTSPSSYNMTAVLWTYLCACGIFYNDRDIFGSEWNEKALFRWKSRKAVENGRKWLMIVAWGAIAFVYICSHVELRLWQRFTWMYI